ncbi:hypothetical protein ACI1O3_002518, partial [Escherichia coli]
HGDRCEVIINRQLWVAAKLLISSTLLHAGCGVNALSGLQDPKKSVNCNTHCRPDKRSASGNITFEIKLDD